MHPHIHPYNHSFIPYIQSIAYAIDASQMLRVVSQSGSRLIRHERRPTGVRRPTHEGIEAAPPQTVPGEKNTDEPQRPSPDLLKSR